MHDCNSGIDKHVRMHAYMAHYTHSVHFIVTSEGSNRQAGSGCQPRRPPVALRHVGHAPTNVLTSTWGGRSNKHSKGQRGTGTGGGTPCHVSKAKGNAYGVSLRRVFGTPLSLSLSPYVYVRYMYACTHPCNYVFACNMCVCVCCTPWSIVDT